MTLILGMSKSEGVYMSVDYRATNVRTGKVVDDAIVKFLTVHYPPEGGPKALLAYTGIAYLPDGTPVGTWIRETLRGESEVFDVSMAHLRNRLDRDVAPLRAPLMVNALVVHGERRFFGGMSNIRLPTWEVQDSFGYVMGELTEPYTFGNGSGAHTVIARGHLEQMKAQLVVRPRRIHDHLNLLATINRRVAAVDKTVSPHCHVAFINADDRYQAVSHTFDEGNPMPMHMPLLLHGIDVSFMVEDFMRRFETGGNDEPDADEMSRHVQRRP